MRDLMSQEECQEYWRNPPKENTHRGYLKRNAAASILSGYIAPHFDKEDKILELGSNVGLVLGKLWEKGFTNLHAVEINSEAIKTMHETFPDMELNVHIGSIEEYAKKLPHDFDLIYTKAVFCHLHFHSDWVFEELAKRTKYIITVEDESTYRSGRHFPRNYRTVFEKFGFYQLHHREQVERMNKAYRMRLMVKP